MSRVGLNRTWDFHILYIRRISVYTIYEGKWVNSEINNRGRRVFNLYILGWIFLRDHSPPKPPFQCPHQTKKGTNLLLFEFYIHLHNYQDLKLKCCRVMGQKLRYGRPCTTWPTRQPQLACTASNCFHFFRAPLTISCWHKPGGLEWIAAPLAWLTPWPTPERTCLWIMDMSTDPPFYPICSKRGAIDWAWAEDSDDRICLKFRGSGPEINWRPTQNHVVGPPHPPPPGFDSYIYQSIGRCTIFRLILIYIYIHIFIYTHIYIYTNRKDSKYNKFNNFQLTRAVQK